MSYGVNLVENFHRAATYVNKKFSKEPNQGPPSGISH